MTENIEERITINASKDDVWNVLSDLGGISKWAAPVATSTCEGAPGEGAVRQCNFADGGAVEETFVKWDEGSSFAYEMTGDLPVQDVLSEWSIQETDDDQGVVVAYAARFSVPEGAPAGPAKEEFGGMAQFLLQALKTYVEDGRVLEPPSGDA